MQNDSRNDRFIPEAIDEQIAQLKQGSQSDAAEARLVKDLERAYREEQEEQAIERIHARLMAKMQPAGDPAMRQLSSELPRRKRIDRMQTYEKRHGKQQWVHKWSVLAAAVVVAIVVGSLITVLQMTHRSSSGGAVSMGASGQQTPAKKTPVTDSGTYLGLFNQLVKVDTQTHKVLWRFVVQSDPKDQPAFQQPLVHYAPIVADGLVYITAQTGRVYAVDAQTGKLRWERNFQVELWPLRMADSLLYVNTTEDEKGNSVSLIYALNPADGTTKTKYNTTGQIAGIFNGVMYLNGGGALTAVKVGDGSQIWVTVIASKGEQNFNSNIYLKNGKLYASSIGKPDSYVYVIDPKNGKITWISPVMDGLVFDIAIGDDGRIYCGAQNHYVYAFDPLLKAQKELWKYHTIVGHVYPAPIIENGTIYVGQSSAGEQNGNDDHLVALDAATGQQKWATSLKGYTGAGDNEPLVFHNGVIYLGSAHGLQGFAPDSGKQVLLIPTDALVSKKDAKDSFMDGIAIMFVD
jgi:outer membrane protein assembly factor BamB